MEYFKYIILNTLNVKPSPVDKKWSQSSSAEI